MITPAPIRQHIRVGTLVRAVWPSGLKSTTAALLLGLVPFIGALAGCAVEPARHVRRVQFASAGRVLTVEVLDDDLAHFEFRPAGSPAPTDEGIRVTPMVHATDFPGPLRFINHGQGRIETTEMRITIDPATLRYAENIRIWRDKYGGSMEACETHRSPFHAPRGTATRY